MLLPPNISSLLAAISAHLDDQVIPAIAHNERLHMQTRAAQELLDMARRELKRGDAFLLAEWERLNGIQGTDIAPPASIAKLRASLLRRNEALAEGIREGKYDDPHGRAALLAHFLVTTREQLEIVNPRYLLEVDRESITG
jgi:hypothetical protein